MSHYTSPPPYQAHPHAHAHATPNDPLPQSTPQSHMHANSNKPHCAPAVHIVMPLSPDSDTLIHQVPNRSRYNESAYLLRAGRGRRRDSDSSPTGGCCSFFAILCAVFIFGLFSIIVFVSYIMPLTEIAWINIDSRSCTTYATKEYVAELNVSSWNRHRMEICMATPAVFHGGLNWPVRCEDRSGRVIGHFNIKNNEPDCVTYWSGYRNMGCTAEGSKKRRIEQRLENLPHRGDYKEFCATTPTRFLDLEFSGADSCVTSIWGVYGQWFIDDDSC